VLDATANAVIRRLPEETTMAEQREATLAPAFLHAAAARQAGLAPRLVVRLVGSHTQTHLDGRIQSDQQMW
jgi:hypothetical protein